MKKLILAATALFFIFCLPGQAQSGGKEYKVIQTIPVGGTGGWDYLAADPAGQRLFITHGSLVEVLDLKTGKVAGRIPDMPGVHGIALVPGFSKGYISAGKLDSVIVFDMKTLKVLKRIRTGRNPDAITYDPYTKRVFTFNGRGNSITAIDAATDSIAGVIYLTGKPEFAVTDGKGAMYCNLEDRSSVVKFDPAALKVMDEWSLGPDKRPTGLAIDLKDNRLFSACSESKQIMVLDAKDGRIITAVPMGEGCDGIIFIPGDQEVIASNGGDGTLTVVKQNSRPEYKVVQTLPTRKSARTIAYDGTTGRIYLPFAEVTIENKKRNIVPGTFGIAVIGK